MSSAFKRKSFSKGRPIKKKVEKLKRPDTRELRAVYSKLAKSGSATTLDYIAEAIQWHDRNIIWFDKTRQASATLKWARARSMQTTRLIQAGITARTSGIKAHLETTKKLYFVDAIKHWEKAVHSYVSVPLIKDVLLRADKSAEKQEMKSNNLSHKYKKLVDMMHGMLPCQLTMRVVAKLPGGTRRKLDHTHETITYDREQAKAMLVLLRKSGPLAVAAEEAFWWARCLSSNVGGGMVDESLVFSNYRQLMAGFVSWAKQPESPKTLVRKEKSTRGTKRLEKKREARRGVMSEALALLHEDEMHPHTEDYNKVAGGEIVL